MSEAKEWVPGTYSDVPFPEYQSIRAVNSGVVTWGGVSMRHMKSALDGDIASTDTKDRKFGRAIHCRLLEPERYKAEYLISTTCCATLGSGINKGKRCGNSGRFFDGANWFCGSHKQEDCNEPADFISESEAAHNEAIANALHTHAVMELFRGECWTEMSCVWETHGVLRKCRIDRFSRKPRPRVIDIKKMQVGAGKREDCEKVIFGNGYYRQMAGNVEAIEALEGVTPEAIWVFIEDGPPYDVQVIPADQQTIEIGRWENNDIIGRFAAAQNKDDYRGYIYDSRFIRWGGLPIWYREQCARLGIGTPQSAGGSGQVSEYAEFGDGAAGEPGAVGPAEHGDADAVGAHADGAE